MYENNKVLHWWLLGAGIILIIIGLLALSSPFVTALTSVVVLGIFLLLAGIAYILVALIDHKSDSFLMTLLVGILNLIVGILMITHPTTTVMALTLLIASLFLGMGIFRIISSILMRFRSWGWVLLTGIIELILGILILAHWPSSALWVIGLFIGIDLIFAGWTFITYSLLAKRLEPFNH